MIFAFIEHIGSWALQFVEKTGYGGLFLTMTLESAGIPIPSELVVPFGGFLVSTGRFEFWLVVLITTLANLLGATLFYFIGRCFGTHVLHKYGKYVLIHAVDIAKMESWLQKYGGRVAFFARVIPGTRTFSSLVIGAGEMRFRTFFVFTFFGSFVWNLPWTYLGYATGRDWNKFQPYIREFDLLIAAVILILIAAYIYRHISKRKHL